MITFNRNELFYNERKSVMLILRDISDIQNLNKKIKDNNTLQAAYQNIQSDLAMPFDKIEEIHEQIMSNSEKSSKELSQDCQSMRNLAKFMLIHTNNLLDLNLILQEKFIQQFNSFSISSATQDMVRIICHKSTVKKLNIVVSNQKGSKDIKDLWLQCDQARFEQVMLSMLNCSVNSAVHGTTINVSFWADEPFSNDMSKVLGLGRNKKSNASKRLELHCKIEYALDENIESRSQVGNLSFFRMQSSVMNDSVLHSHHSNEEIISKNMSLAISRMICR